MGVLEWLKNKENWPILIFGGIAVVAYISKYIIKGIWDKDWSLFLDPLFSFFLVLSISIFFDNKTRKELYKLVTQKIDEYFSKITVPPHEEIKEPMKKFLTYLNLHALPYEKRREFTIRFEAVSENKQIIHITVIYQILYDRGHLSILGKKEENVLKNYTIDFPEEEILQLFPESSTNDPEKWEREAIRILRNKISITLNSESPEGIDERVNILKEKVEKKYSSYLYHLQFAIPIKELMQLSNPQFKLKTSHQYKCKNGYYTMFRTFCENLQMRLIFDSSILKQFKIEDIRNHIYIHPIDYSNVRQKEKEDYYETYVDNSLIEVNWKNIIPGSALLVEWDFTPSSPPTP